MNPFQTASDGADGPDLIESRQLRLDAAAAAGVPAVDAERMLNRIEELEPREYLSATGLSWACRRKLLALRAGLRSLDPAEVELELSLSHSPTARTVQEYWSWLIGAASPPSSTQRNRLPGNLAAAVGRMPERREFVLSSWLVIAELIGIDKPAVHAALAELDAVMRRCNHGDVEQPTDRALELAIVISILTGLPNELGQSHRSAWLEQAAVIWRSQEWFAAKNLQSSMSAYRRSGGDAWSGRGKVWIAYAGHAPYPEWDDGMERIVLSRPEAMQLGGDIPRKVLIWLVESLRLGRYPGRGLAIRAATAVYIDRRHFRRDGDGEWIGRQRDELPHEVPEPEEPDDETADDRNAIASQVIVARGWLAGAIIDSIHRLTVRYEQAGAAAVFPTEFYREHRSSGLGVLELRASQNWLQHTLGRIEFDPTTLSPRLAAEGRARAAIALHMRATVPQQWNDSVKGRQLTVGFGAAVGWAGWLAITAVDPADAPDLVSEIAVSLVSALRQHAALATLDALTVAIPRFARPAGRCSLSWFTTVSAGASSVGELAGSLAGSPRLATDQPPTGVASTCADLRQLGMAYREVARAGQGTRSLTPDRERYVQLEVDAQRMITAADRIADRWGVR